jgi:hypothetical protein
LFLLILSSPAFAQKLEKMRVGYNAITGSNSALWISREAGLTALKDFAMCEVQSFKAVTRPL